MMTYQKKVDVPAYEEVLISEWIARNYEEKERKNFEDWLWGCGLCFKLYEQSDAVLLCTTLEEEYFCCPNHVIR